MFTGIIEEVGKIQSISQNKISVSANKITDDLKLGDSVAVNGVCLTVTKFSSNFIEADVSPETMKVTMLRELKSGDMVNLERALPVNGRLGGHIVSGHTDGIGRLKSIRNTGDFYNIEIEIPQEYQNQVVKKGSIAINGISLTVADIQKNIVSIAVIPHTFENTNLKTLYSGDYVNIETDILAKYVEKFLSTSDNKTGISMEFLMENGF